MLENIMKRMKSVIRSLFCLYLACLVLPALAESSYKINPGDVLRIDIWNEESLTREAVVRPDGYISFPLVGEILVGIAPRRPLALSWRQSWKNS